MFAHRRSVEGVYFKPSLDTNPDPNPDPEPDPKPDPNPDPKPDPDPDYIYRALNVIWGYSAAGPSNYTEGFVTKGLSSLTLSP